MYSCCYCDSTILNATNVLFLPKDLHFSFQISCHGVPWIASWLAFVWVLNSSSLYQMQVNFMIGEYSSWFTKRFNFVNYPSPSPLPGLLLDIVIVALVKAITRRRRPAFNDDVFAMGPDKFSFPSGHASRAMFVVYFFFNLWPINWIFRLPMLAWMVCVCLSRILLERHYLLDVLAGVLLGIVEGLFVGLIYLDQETCVSLVSWISDEKVEGGEYHVWKDPIFDHSLRLFYCESCKF